MIEIIVKTEIIEALEETGEAVLVDEKGNEIVVSTKE